MEPNFVESVNSANYWKRPREETENRSFNFNIKPEEMDFHRGRKSCKQQRDPMSHRIIEKRRRDRMNNCLADLSRLIPHGYIKQGQGRIEKTEIIEMAIKHITSLQMQVKHAAKTGGPVAKDDIKQSFVQGFQMCKTEVFTFLVEVEGVSPSNPFCTRICSHLDNKTKALGEQAVGLKDAVETISMDGMKTGTDYKTLEVEVKPQEPNKMELAAKSPPIIIDQSKTGQRSNMLSDLETDSGVSLKSLNTSSQFSSQTSSDESMEERGAENKGYYKFKHCIRRRFSREIKSDSSSVSSQEQDREVRHKHGANRHHKLSSSTSSVQSSASSTSSIESSASTSGEQDGMGLIPSLPGFVIHPSGTHYVPISVNQSFLPDLLDSSNYSNQKVFHPISIPVHFCAAYKLKV